MISSIAHSSQLMRVVQWKVIAIAMLIGVAMISSRSFWIDEGATAWYAIRPSFDQLFSQLLSDCNSEAFMPFYIVNVWVWAQMVGTSEWWLRANNLLWLFLLLSGSIRVALKSGVRSYPLIIFIQPFLWQYVNELRPYAMQMGFSVWLLVAMLDIEGDRNPVSRSVVFSASVFGICSANALGFIPAAVMAAFGACIYIWRKRYPTRQEWVAYIFGLFLMLSLAFFYYHALRHGASGARLWIPSMANMFYAVYELTGMTGLGPSRWALRTAGQAGSASVIAALKPFVIMLVLYGVSLVVLIVAAASHRRKSLFVFTVCVLFVCMVLMMLLSYFIKWPFWGRHLAPLLPIYAFLPAMGVDVLWQQRKSRIVCVVPILFLLVSMLSLQYSGRFVLDDYREAARLGLRKAKADKIIWWAAAVKPAEYYGLKFDETHQKDGQLFATINADNLHLLPVPDVVFLSRPESFDANGMIQKWIREHTYLRGNSEIVAFEVWHRE